MVHALIIIGSKGFIGGYFRKAFPNALAIDRSELDLLNPQICFSTEGYRFAIIAAGIGNPRKCEQDPKTSYLCNVKGTLKLGLELWQRGVFPVFFSTDYVFDDNLKVSPLNMYGKQKKELEERASHFPSLTLRLSKVYGIEKGDNTLFDEMAAKLMRNETVLAAKDQVFSPICVSDVIRQTVTLLENGTQGVVNLFGPSFASRLHMAQTLAKHLRVNAELVKEISLADLKDGIQRPKFLKLYSTFPALSWEEGIKQVVAAYAR